MKIATVLSVVAAGCLSAYLATHPPVPGQAAPAPVDTFLVPPADIMLDTPEIRKSIERMNRKAEILNQKTEQIRRNGRAIEQETRLLLKVVQQAADTAIDADSAIVSAPELPAADTPRVRVGLWRRFLNLFPGR